MKHRMGTTLAAVLLAVAGGMAAAPQATAVSADKPLPVAATVAAGNNTPTGRQAIEVRDGIVLHQDRVYTKAEVNKIAAKTVLNKGGVTPSITYDPGGTGYYLQEVSRFHINYTDEMQLALYYNGYQNLAYTDHLGETRGVPLYTLAVICTTGQVLHGPCTGKPDPDYGNFLWFAGPVYSGDSRFQCIAANGILDYFGQTQMHLSIEGHCL